MAEKHTSDTLTGGPKQGRRNETNRRTSEAAGGGRDSAGLTNRGSSVGAAAYGGTSGAAGLDRHRLGRDEDRQPGDDASSTVTSGEKAAESRNIKNPMSSASSGMRNTTTGPGEAGHNPEPERKGNIYDPEHPDPYGNPKVE